ncbi:protein FAR1-RELATED SEQUENCE 5-like [Tripterygium wilfordii]|uniref:protein FAR1-RELATED SEQUENCE 5-like n=1 Tax=Tripterygium wilfordii TaxID=458696 RepID=UPI0018F83E15|nr:protein FAR1-RELATED SEQUENCE 5-like [Tripterygium wilfordii]
MERHDKAYHGWDDQQIEGSNMVMNNDISSSDDSVEGLGNFVSEEAEVPLIGMFFEDENQMFQYYKRYGQRTGFPMKKRTVNKDKDELVKYLTFTCDTANKSSTHTNNFINHRSNAKVDCKARLRARLSKECKWEITNFIDEHNHVMSPSKSRYFSCNRLINPHIKRHLEINGIAGIRANKSHNAQVIGAGGMRSYCFWNNILEIYLQKLDDCDLAKGMPMQFKVISARCNHKMMGFFSLIDWDEKACREFGDVITFDMTYLTNKYDMPFAPFVGVNHHGQSILLGYGLISNEDTDTFIWLFQTWLSCMHNVSPAGIITDQDRAIKNAIEVVFPATRHRLCLWHIMKKVSEKLGSYKEYENIIYDLGEAVYDSQSTYEFERCWESMIAKFHLTDNGWLKIMYDLSEIWVPIYVKNFFWVGMSSTQRSEGVNAFLDGYVNSKTTLRQFVEQYNNALRDKAEKESKVDFNSFNKQLKCATSYGMEKQILNLYTQNKFKEFQNELTELIYCGIKSVVNNENLAHFYVEEDVFFGDKGRKKVEYNMCYDSTSSIVFCTCCKFEFRAHYIFRCWRKEIRRPYSRVKVNYDGMEITGDQQRYDKLCNMFTYLADLAADSEHNFNYVANLIEGAMSTFSALSTATPVSALNVAGCSNDPLITRGKGRPSSVRKKRIFKRSARSSKNSNEVLPASTGTNGSMDTRLDTQLRIPQIMMDIALFLAQITCIHWIGHSVENTTNYDGHCIVLSLNCMYSLYQKKFTLLVIPNPTFSHHPPYMAFVIEKQMNNMSSKLTNIFLFQSLRDWFVGEYALHYEHDNDATIDAI